MRNRILLAAGALVVVAVPAVIGVWGNASFAGSVPVRVPPSGRVATPLPSPSASVDDNGGDRARDVRVEPGDDHGGHGGDD